MLPETEIEQKMYKLGEEIRYKALNMNFLLTEKPIFPVAVSTARELIKKAKELEEFIDSVDNNSFIPKML